ncbi:MAG TPA: hypothetical protein VH681_07255 [Nitrospiraceae bacterium]
MNRSAALIGFLLVALAQPAARAEDPFPTHSQQTVNPTNEASCHQVDQEGFENIQIETADIRLHEQLFEQVLSVPAVQRLDHPLTDHIRAYCFRGVLVVIRQDLRTPRPTGWVQLNFIVKDVVAVQRELESAYRAAALSQLSEQERDKIVRFRMKPDVMRGNRKVNRLEVYGAEGFLIGFDELK